MSNATREVVLNGVSAGAAITGAAAAVTGAMAASGVALGVAAAAGGVVIAANVANKLMGPSSPPVPFSSVKALRHRPANRGR